MTINYFKLPVLQQPKCTNVLCDIYAERERERSVCTVSMIDRGQLSRNQHGEVNKH